MIKYLVNSASRNQRVLSPDEYLAWDNFVARHPAGRLYHTTSWKQALDAGYGPSRYEIAVVHRDKEIVGGCCYLQKRKWGIVPVASNPLLTQYCGYLFGDAAREDDVRRLCKFMSKSFLRQRFACAPGVILRPNLGYQQSKKITLYLPLNRPLDEVRGAIDSAMQRQIRKAQRCNPELVTYCDPLEVNRLLRLTLARNGRNAAVPDKLVNSLVSHEALLKTRKVLMAKMDGLPASVIVYFVYKQVAYYSIAATDPEKLSTGISPWLVDKFIESCHLSGVREIDFLGGNLESVAQFKRKFGALERGYVELSRRWF